MYRIISFNRAATKRGFDFFTLASTPHGEDCTQAGQSRTNQVLECMALINQLIRENGPAPDDAEFFIVRNEGHDFGDYYEAGIFYKEPEEEAEETEEEAPGLEYAQKIECNIPEYWDKEAKEELRENGHPNFQPAKIVAMEAA